MLKYLCIIVTALSLLACALLIALWVRSYWREYTIVVGLTDHRGFLFDSSAGTLMLNYWHEFGTSTGKPNVVLSKC
ncbi:MAG TPA: hypothetical protein VJ828_04225 [Lacipirellulaceae bacterium]|nr:hypothetical protein [Lacipirellulaceae bacterium]